MSFYVVYMLPVFYRPAVGYLRCVLSHLSGCGNLWGDKDFWYIIVCYVYIDYMFVSGGGGWICRHVVGGGEFS